MRAAVLVGNGDPRSAFEIQVLADPIAEEGQVVVDVQTFGLNFADVMARLGKYRDCPPLPAIIGYEAVGHIAALGEGVEGLKLGQRVVAFTRFGAYATKVVTQANAVVPIDDSISNGEAAALATQYTTAYYAAEEMVNLHEGDRVLVQSAAGGVGTALVQLLKRKGCYLYGTAGSEKKLDYLRSMGVDFPINYNEFGFDAVIKEHSPNGKIDAVFDAVGGDAVRKGFSILDSGGRIVCYGAATMSDRGKAPIKTLRNALGFGVYHPAVFMMNSKSMIGVNMLRIADNKPQVLQRCLMAVVDLAKQGEIKPKVGGEFDIEDLAIAHEYLEMRRSIGKVVVNW